MINFFKFDKYQKNIYSLKNKKQQKIVFINPHSYVYLFKDRQYFDSVKNCTAIFIDGIGVHFLLRLKFFFLNKKYSYKKITGFDYFNYVIKKSYNKKILLIGKEDVLLKLKNNITITNPSLKIYILKAPLVKNNFKKKHLDIIFKGFNKSTKIDYCFVGTGSPKQEKLVNLIDNELIKKDNIKIDIIAGIGAVFDYYSKKISFLFYFSRYFNFEWLYRLLTNRRLWNRTFVSLPAFFMLIFFSVKPKYFELRVSNQVSRVISQQKKVIYSAFNLASYSYISNSKIQINKYFYFWVDGIFANIFTNKYKKMPGRELISNLSIDPNIKKIHVIGTLSEKSRIFLLNKFQKKIKNTNLPFGSIKKIIHNVPKVKANELVLITLPTPKQEIIAQYISKKNKNFKIICIGGGLNIASKEEKPCPKFLDKIGMESLWRLRYQTRRRVLRLSWTLICLMQSFFSMFHKRILINEE